MSDNLSHLALKARSFQDAMAFLPKKELALTITGEYANEYNKMRNMVRDALPDLEEHLPPIINVEKGAQSGMVCQTRYVELLTYCRTLLRLVEAADPPRMSDLQRNKI